MGVRGDGDGWVVCGLGHRHWGRYGAAGLLLRHRGHVLLAHRVWWSHHGGTWGIPGGARDSDETAEAAAVREAVEETAVDPERLAVGGATTDDHGGWSYVTVHADLDAEQAPHLVPADGEATELRWVPVDDVTKLDLHPGFAASWSGGVGSTLE